MNMVKSIQKLLIGLLITHIALFAGNLWYANVTNPEVPYYGGVYGFVPSTSEEDSLYTQTADFITGVNSQPSSPSGGVIGLLKWAAHPAVCGTSDALRSIIAYTTFTGYTYIEILPTGGFLDWIRLIAVIAGNLVQMTLGLIGFVMLIRSGALANVWMLAALGILTTGGIVIGGIGAGVC